MNGDACAMFACLLPKESKTVFVGKKETGASMMIDTETKKRLQNLSKQARRLRKYRDDEKYREAYEEVQGALKRRALEITGRV